MNTEWKEEDMKQKSRKREDRVDVRRKEGREKGKKTYWRIKDRRREKKKFLLAPQHSTRNTPVIEGKRRKGEEEYMIVKDENEDK